MPVENISSSRDDLRRSTGLCVALLLVATNGCAPVRTLPPPSGGQPLQGIPVPRLTPGEPWTGWDDAREPLVSFSSVRGWTVVAEPAADTRFERVSNRTGGSHPAARLSASGPDHIERVRLVPPRPIPIPEPFDSVEIRLGSDDATPISDRRPELIVHLAPDDGTTATTREVRLGGFPTRGWRLAHHRLADDRPRRDVMLSALEIRDWNRPTDGPLYLAGLTFYLESRAPIVAAWLADPNESRPIAFLDPLPNEGSTGVRVPTVPFLLRETSLDRERQLVELAYRENDRRIAYIVRYGQGIRRVDITVDRVPIGSFVGLEWATPSGTAADDRCVAAGRAANGEIQFEFADGRQARVAMQGRSLVVCASAEARTISAFQAPVWNTGDPVEMPFLNGRHWRGPSLWRVETPEGGFLGVAGAWLDPEYSGATRWEWPPEREAAGGACRAVYEPATRGRRPPLRERLVLTVGARLEDVLPEYTAPGAREPHPPPAAGWREMEVDDDLLDPRHPSWSRYLLRREADGQWIEISGAGRYAMKWPMLPLIHGPALEARREEWTPADVAFAALLSSRPPWNGVDYDSRVPGAAQFRPSWLAWRQWLDTLGRSRGKPVIGRDPWVWMNAPVMDAWHIAQERSAYLLAKPANPLFALLRLKPMGVGLLPAPTAEAGVVMDAAWDRWTAALLWYGLWPGLGAEEQGFPAERARRLTADLAALTLGRAPERIAFHDGHRLIGTAEALGARPPATPSRLYLRYAPDVEIWINRDEANAWRLAIGGEDWTLPPNGFAARAEHLFVCSAQTETGTRADYAASREGIFFDPRESYATIRDVAADGAIMLRPQPADGGSSWEVTFLTAARRLALRLPKKNVGAIVHILATNAEGAALGAARGEWEKDWLRIALPEGVERLHIAIGSPSADL